MGVHYRLPPPSPSILAGVSSSSLLISRAVKKGRNPYHLLHLSMLDEPLMLRVNWPVVDTIHPYVTILLPLWRSRLQVNQNLMTALVSYPCKPLVRKRHFDCLHGEPSWHFTGPVIRQLCMLWNQINSKLQCNLLKMVLNSCCNFSIIWLSKKVGENILVLLVSLHGK